MGKEEFEQKVAKETKSLRFWISDVSKAGRFAYIGLYCILESRSGKLLH